MPMPFWNRSIGRSGTRTSRGLWPTSPTSIDLTPQQDLAAILCHVEERVIGNDHTFSFAGRRYQILRSQAQAGMRRQRVRVELRLDGELKVRYEGRYLEIAECGTRPATAEPKASKAVRKDHNAGGRSNWMDGFFDRPSPPLWRCIGD